MLSPTPPLLLSSIDYSGLLADIRAVVRAEIATLAVSPVTLAPVANTAAEDLLSVQQTAELLHVSRQTVHVWQRDGLLPYRKLSRRTYFSQTDLLASMEKHERMRKAVVRAGNSLRRRVK